MAGGPELWEEGGKSRIAIAAAWRPCAPTWAEATPFSEVSCGVHWKVRSKGLPKPGVLHRSINPCIQGAEAGGLLRVWGQFVLIGLR